jgi:hypothetical protein
MSTKESKRRGKQLSRRIQILREKGKTKEDQGKEAKKKATHSGCKCSLDRNTKKRRKADKGKEEKRKATHSGCKC